MKVLLPIALLIIGLSWGCTQKELVQPLAEEKAETCNLYSQAAVEYREAGHNSSQPFLYLVLISETGNRYQDVFPASFKLEDSYKVGDKVEVTFHYDFSGDMVYVSACGNGDLENPVYERMAQIVICGIKGNS
ncbi:MAG: hypothetical protein SF052_05105 [Bacteroidia bacterium]|nr:hypothetical protein [Bacteroidia bacterium]